MYEPCSTPFSVTLTIYFKLVASAMSTDVDVGVGEDVDGVPVGVAVGLPPLLEVAGF